jgi:hypothetical protein
MWSWRPRLPEGPIFKSNTRRFSKSENKKVVSMCRCIWKPASKRHHHTCSLVRADDFHPSNGKVLSRSTTRPFSTILLVIKSSRKLHMQHALTPHAKFWFSIFNDTNKTTFPGPNLFPDIRSLQYTFQPRETIATKRSRPPSSSSPGKPTPDHHIMPV